MVLGTRLRSRRCNDVLELEMISIFLKYITFLSDFESRFICNNIVESTLILTFFLIVPGEFKLLVYIDNYCLFVHDTYLLVAVASHSILKREKKIKKPKLVASLLTVSGKSNNDIVGVDMNYFLQDTYLLVAAVSQLNALRATEGAL